jgi:hypothetical protein
MGKLEHVYACETRPYNQGARLTAFEIVQDGLPGTLIAGNAFYPNQIVFQNTYDNTICSVRNPFLLLLYLCKIPWRRISWQ